MFDRTNRLSRLTEAHKWGIITLHRDGQKKEDIAKKMDCSVKAVTHWINQHAANETVKEKHRTGRKRKTDENTNINIAVTAEVEPFKKPKNIKAALDLDVSRRTVDRRLIEAGKPGRVAIKEHDYTPVQLRARVSFGEGYKRWTKEDWSLVLFSDETHIDLGQHGQIWVRRPVGEMYNPEYMAHKDPHPERVSVWACISSRGLGGIDIFTDNLDGPLLKNILQEHLVQAAHRLFPPGAWWLLWDNAPNHYAVIVSRWMHNHGISLVDFRSYSPDLNPIENFWNDLKRRVETHNATNTTELQQHIMIEWENTDLEFLAKIVDSMPDRCKAVIASEGHKIPY